MPFWSTLSLSARHLLSTVGAAYAIQGAVAIPCIIGKTDTYYDISGTATYLSCTALSLLYNHNNPRKLLLSALVTVWSGRLGLYLFDRVKKTKGDSRFEKIKQSPIRFWGAFMIQATWVALIGLPVYAVNVIPSRLLPGLGFTDAVGLAVWIAGFALEVAADSQMKEWARRRREKEHDELFLKSGVWSWSRHPNYAGESIIWIGNAIIAAGALVARNSAAAEVFGRGAGLAMCAASPLFITFLLLKVSGVPIIEKKYDDKFKDNKEYQEWKKNTPKFFPKIF